jgi:signal transduction histidine kinase
MYADVGLRADAPARDARYRPGVTSRTIAGRLTRRGVSLLDLAIAAGAVFIGVGALLTAEDDPAYRDPDILAVALAVATTVPLVWRRRAPLPALVVSTAAITLICLREYPVDPLPIAVLFLTYGVAAYASLRRAQIGLAIVVVALLVIWASDPPDFGAAGLSLNLALFIATWLAGLAMRSRAAAAAARLAEAEERAEAHRQQAARSVAEERLRIAQDLHDVVAHSMSVIAVQAGMGAHVIDRQPAEAKQALESISRTSRATLHEMRHLLGVLRGDDGQRAHVPAPGLGDLPALVEQVRSAGVPVELQVDGQPSGVPLGVDLSAYRVVQEGLTNVIKHAGAATAAVHVRYAPGEIVVEVSDDGRGAGATARDNGGGHGLAGMRERVAVWGGTLHAGPVAGGGYRVLAHLPYGEPS